MNVNLSSLLKTGPGPAVVHETLLKLLEQGDGEALARSCQGKASALNHRPALPGVPLLLAAATQDAADLIRILLDAKADVNVMDANGATAISVAARRGATSALRELLQAGAEVNRPRASGATPIYVAAQAGTKECLALLLEAGGDPNAPKEGGFTPACVACLTNRPACLALLLRAGADANRASMIADCFTPLHVAAHFGHTALIEALLNAGALVGVRDAQGRTAREVALGEGQALAASLLAGREHEEAHEGALAEQEALVQELRHMQPVQDEIEISQERIDALNLRALAPPFSRLAGLATTWLEWNGMEWVGLDWTGPTQLDLGLDSTRHGPLARLDSHLT